VTAKWFDPTNGTLQTVAGSPFPNQGSHDFTTPGDNSRGDPDWVLLFQAQAGGTPTPTPTGCSVTSAACGSIVVGTPPTDFTVNLSDPADPATVQGSDFMVNGTPANTASLLNGNMTITFHFNTSPAVQGENTMHIPAGAFNCGNGGVQEFTCTFTYPASTPTPTPTASPMPTSTPAARVTPTPRPRPSPAPRP
jgi:Putative collagen-binding domain of a collagenase